MEILSYLLKSTAILSLFLLVYELFLKRETFYRSNRIFLLSGIFTAYILPFLHLQKTVVTTEVAEPISTDSDLNHTVLLDETTAPLTAAPGFWESLDFTQIILWIYLIVAAFLIGKLLFSLIKLLFFLRNHTSTRVENGLRFIEIKEATGPFSFFKHIVYNPELHSKEELHLILKHEKAHAQYHHSIDQLLANLIVCLNWFNPLIRHYHKRISQNLEFIADEIATATISNPKAYQLSLLNHATINTTALPVNNFHKSFIHTRIKKLHQKKSGKPALLKTILILPLLTGFFFLFQIQSRAEIIYVTEEFPLKITRVELIEFNFNQNRNLDSKELEQLKKHLGENQTTETHNHQPNALQEEKQNKIDLTTDTLLPNEVNGKKIRSVTIEAADFNIQESTADQEEQANSTSSLHKKLKEYFESHSNIVLNGKKTDKNDLSGQFYNYQQIHFNEDDNQLHISGKPIVTNIREALIQSEGEIIVHFQKDQHLRPVVMNLKKSRTIQLQNHSGSENKKQSIKTSKAPSFLITASTTKEELRALQKKIKNEQNAALHFSNLKQDDQGNLIQLSLRLRPKNGKDQHYSVIGSLAIPDIQLILSDDFTGFRTFTKNDKSASVDRNSAIIINGKPDSDTDEDLKTILIKNRENSDSKLENPEITKLIKSIDVIKGEDTSIILINDKENSAKKDSGKNPNKISQNDKVFTIHKKTTDKELEEIKTFFSTKNILFSYRISKRNKSGEITKIKIKTNDQAGKKSAVDYQNNKGISTFKTGIKNGEFFID